MDRMICKKGFVLFLFLHRTLCFGYFVRITFNKYPKRMFLKVLIQYSWKISHKLSPLERRFRDIQIVITNFVIGSSVGIKRVGSNLILYP